MNRILSHVICFSLITISFQLFAQNVSFEVIEEFAASEARQGIAVDSEFVYVIGSQQIAKYNKVTHELVNKWVGPEEGPIIHLDSGVIIDGKLYCAHSNYPELPMTSSIEVWDVESLEHIDNHSFGINWGSCTWVDKLAGYWYAAFAQYDKWEHASGKGSEWTVVVKFDCQWRHIESWTFPKEVYQKFGHMSNSGGSFGSDGLLYCTGHDNPELYAMAFPKYGSVLELIRIIPIKNSGQGIAWDRFETNRIYGIIKSGRKVIVSKFIAE